MFTCCNLTVLYVVDFVTSESLRDICTHRKSRLTVCAGTSDIAQVNIKNI